MWKRQDDTSAKLGNEITDEFMVDSLEALMAVQKPASEPWTPLSDYSLEGRRQIEEPHARLIRDVFNPGIVLDVGCGPDAVLVRLLSEIGVCVFGYDKQPPVSLNNCWRYDVSAEVNPHAMLFTATDLVICREVLEHLTIRELVRAVRRLVKMSTKYVYVTTRFSKSHAHLLDVQTSDDLDPTHQTMLTKEFLRLLFVLEGCKRRADLEVKMDWMKKGRVLVYEVPA